MQTQFNKGFTIIELMIALIILSIAMSFAIPSYRTFTANAQIRSTAESIRSGLQIARAEAIKRNSNVRFTLATDSSWVVGCPVVNANCPATIQTKTAKEGGASTVSIVRVGSTNIIFNSFGMRVATAGQLSQVDVDNSAISAADSRNLRVTIATGGAARVCDPNVSVPTDPRFCS